jgi:multicomponent K+:H+ antiporter subunit E
MKLRLFPHPVLTVALILIWLLLVNSFTFGHLLLGTILGIAIPHFSQKFWPERVRIAHPLRLLRFILVIGYDILTANITVARLIVWRADRLHPGFFTIPLEVKSDMAISLLANIISLTPGTLSARLSPDRRELLVHALHLDDAAEQIATIKQRYERPLLEILESC